MNAPTTPTTTAPPPQPNPASPEESRCDRGAGVLLSLESVLRAGYSIVHVRPTTVPASRAVHLVGQGSYGHALTLERSHFEASVIRSCGAAMPAGGSLRLNRPTRQRHERPDGSWEVLDVDPLRGGPTGAPIRDREDALLIVTPDSQVAGEWLVLGAIELRGGAIAAPIYNSNAGSDAAGVISACNAYRPLRRGSR